MEGRAFILGRNGFYNKIIETLKKNNIYQIYFVFLFKSETEEEMRNSLENLIKKGDQKDLEFFLDNNQIIYINESILENKDKREKLNFFLCNKILFNYLIFKNFEVLNFPVYIDKINLNKYIKNTANNINEFNEENNKNNNSNEFKINPFHKKFEKYLDNNIYYKKENSYIDKKNFYNEQVEILEKLKYIKIFQKYSKEKNGDNNSSRFNCEIL